MHAYGNLGGHEATRREHNNSTEFVFRWILQQLVFYIETCKRAA